MIKYFEMSGHKLCAVQLDKDSVRRCVCVLDDEHNMAYLISYYTVVAVYNMKLEKLYRTWPDWSRTTARHVNLFRKYLEKECGAHFTYYEWKDACKDYSEYGPMCLPFDFLVRQTRQYIPLADNRVNWNWCY